MTNAAKAFVANYVWLPYGGLHSYTGTTQIDLRFPGQLMQAESGLYYNWNRQYDPTTGRYTQTDPLGLVDGSSRYAYVGNDPLQAVDPEGLQFIGRGGGGRIFGYLGDGWGFRMDYMDNPGPTKLHFHCGAFDSGGVWGGHRPWYAPWKTF